MTPFTAGLLATPKAVPVLRHAVREHLGGQDWPDLELCVSELVSNVITHLGEGTPVAGVRTGDTRRHVAAVGREAGAGQQ